MNCRIIRTPRGMTKYIYNGGEGPAYVIDEDANTILKRSVQDASVPAFDFKVKVPFEFWDKSNQAFKPLFEASIGKLQQIVLGLRSTFEHYEGQPPEQMVMFLFRDLYARELGLAKEDLVVPWNPNASGATARVIGSGSTGWVVGGKFGLVARAGQSKEGFEGFPFEKVTELSVEGYRYGMSVERLTPLVNDAILNAFYGEDYEQPAGRIGGLRA